MSCLDSHRSLRLLVGILDDDKEEVLVGGDEDFLSARAHSEESHVVHGVDVTHDAPCLHCQVGNMVSNVLRGGRRVLLVPLRDNAALIVNDKQGAHTRMATDPVDALFKVSHL